MLIINLHTINDFALVWHFKYFRDDLLWVWFFFRSPFSDSYFVKLTFNTVTRVLFCIDTITFWVLFSFFFFFSLKSIIIYSDGKSILDKGSSLIKIRCLLYLFFSWQNTNIKRHPLYTLREHLDSPTVFGGSYTYRSSF